MNKFMFALFLGYVLINEKPPKFLVWYVRTHKPETEDENIWLALTILRLAPNFSDIALRGLVKAALK